LAGVELVRDWIESKGGEDIDNLALSLDDQSAFAALATRLLEHLDLTEGQMDEEDSQDDGDDDDSSEEGEPEDQDGEQEGSDQGQTEARGEEQTGENEDGDESDTTVTPARWGTMA
jgi:cobaltochelatase CobT